ncbi:hypothetical protein ABH926_000704 [Catenulispora sp. GP43]|uniref:hypothetical protein n=1 Tax=Catenulispora sp. GP43 TaxID=3156263 RepID=UPI003517FAA6
MRHTRVRFKKTALAAAGHSHYANFDFAGESVTFPAFNIPPTQPFPSVQITTDSTAPSQASGRSAFLNASTPFAQVFGSSQGEPYALLRSAKGLNPSATVVHFDRPLVPGTRGFALGDVDAEKTRVTAYDAAGRQVPVGFQGSFNYCQGTPLPSVCAGQTETETDQPTWDPGTSYLVGNVADTNGAAGWFRPDAAVSTRSRRTRTAPSPTPRTPASPTSPAACRPRPWRPWPWSAPERR